MEEITPSKVTTIGLKATPTVSKETKILPVEIETTSKELLTKSAASTTTLTEPSTKFKENQIQ